MNRRGFFRLLAGATALAAGVKPLPLRPSSINVYFTTEVTYHRFGVANGGNLITSTGCSTDALRQDFLAAMKALKEFKRA